MSGVKCVNLGLPKTGTTTLAFALGRAGLMAADHRVRRAHTKKRDLRGTFVARQLYRGYFETGDPFHYLDLYDALTEISVLNGKISLWPQCDYAILKAMRLARPDMIFLATWRPPEEVADSMMRWNTLGSERLPTGSVPGLPYGFGQQPDELMRWVGGHYDMLRDIFGDDPRYLELPVGAADARARLSAHLSLDLPWWGRRNANPDQQTQGAA